MQGNITVAKSWNELNDWQLQEIAHLYLNTKAEDFAGAYLQMILIVYQKSPDPKSRQFLRKLTKEVPVSELEKHTGFLKEKIDFHKFPEIPGLIKPADRLRNITIFHFSAVDAYFHFWFKEKNLIDLKRFVASLYRINEDFDELDLPKVDRITRNISVKKMEAIALAFWFTKMHIADRFPIVFPKKKEAEDEELKPVFKKKDDAYVPFDKAILAMAMDDLQPLGKKQDINKVRIYEFFPVMSESIIYNKAKQKANEGK